MDGTSASLPPSLPPPGSARRSSQTIALMLDRATTFMPCRPMRPPRHSAVVAAHIIALQRQCQFNNDEHLIMVEG